MNCHRKERSDVAIPMDIPETYGDCHTSMRAGSQ